MKLADEEGLTALARAVLNGNCDLAMLLMEKGADVNTSDKERKTVLILAAERNQLDTAKNPLNSY